MVCYCWTLTALLGGRSMAGAVLPWAGEFQVKIISACLFSAVFVVLNFVVKVLVNSEGQNSGFCCVQILLFKAG